jgi:AraC-like DNA-binding protein
MALSHAAFVRLCRARDRLRAADERPLTIDAIAREAAVSPFHFIRQFQSVFGTTPHQYRIAAKLARARQLLAGRQYTVTDVCVELGFSSLASFSHLFERHVGMRPSTYRREVRAQVTVPGPHHVFEAPPGCLSLMGEAFARSTTDLPGALTPRAEHRAARLPARSSVSPVPQLPLLVTIDDRPRRR